MVRSAPPMAAVDDTLLGRVRTELAKAGVRSRLLSFALWLVRSPHDAEDLLQSALARVVDPQGSPWDSNGGKTFSRHVGAVMINLASNERHGGRARFEVVDSNIARDDDTIDGAPLADQALHEHREVARMRRMGDELLVELDKNDALAAGVFRAMCGGLEGASEIAANVGCKPDEVRYAYDRIKYHAQRVLDRHRVAEQRRMSELRQAGRRGQERVR